MGVNKTFTKTATKVSGLSKSEKKIVKVTVNKSKKKVTVKGLKPGKASFKIGSKSYTVKVGAVAIKKKSFATSLKVGTNKKVTVTSSYGAKDTLKWSSSKTSVVKVSKATTTASAKKVGTNTLNPVKAGTATITVKSKNTGKSLKVKVTVKAAETATATPAATAPTATATGSATTTPSVAPTATTTATATGSATTAPSVDPSAVPTATGSATTAPTATGSATTAPSAVPTVDPSATPTTAPTQTPEVVSASVVSATAVNTQDQEVALDAVTKNGSIKVTFSEVVKDASVNNTTFKLTDASGKNISLPASDVTLLPGGKVAKVDLKNVSLDKNASYTLTISGVNTKVGEGVAKYTTTFTISNTAVIETIKMDNDSDNDDFDTNLNKDSTSLAGGLATSDGKTIVVKYDAYVDASTANATNIALTNTTTGERVPLTYDANNGNGYIVIQTKTALLSNNLYKLTIEGVKTAVGGEAESLSHIFTVAGKAPFSSLSSDSTSVQYVTVDGTALGNNVWPKLVAGMKDTVDINDSKYYAGLQINITVAERLDPESVQNNVILVEKETKEIVDTTITYNADAKMITIIPKADLKEEVEYQIQFLGGLRTTDFVYLNANKKTEVYTGLVTGSKGSNQFKTMDASCPEVGSIVSKSGDTSFEISKAHEFGVKFSESITLNKANVMLVESSADVETVTATEVNTNARTKVIADSAYDVIPVAGTDSKEWTVRIKGTTLEANKAYKLYIVGKDMKDYAIVLAGNKAVLKDANNNRLKKSSVYTFSTEYDTTAPALVSVYAGDKIDAEKVITDTKTNVLVDDKFTFMFDEVIAAGANVYLEKNVNGSWNSVDENGVNISNNVEIVDDQVKNADDEKVAVTVKVNTALTDGKYRIVFPKNAIKDKVSPNPNVADEIRYEFVGSKYDTADDVKIYSGTKADASDVVAAAIENNNSQDSVVNADSRFFFVLNESSTTGLDLSKVVVKDAKGNVVEGELKEVVDATVLSSLASQIGQLTNTDGDQKTVYTFVPTKKLAYGTKYTITIDGVKDVYGNAIEKKEITFKTVTQGDRVSSVSIEDNATSVNRTPKITIKLNNKLGDNDLTATNSDPSAIEYRVAIKDLSNPNTEQYVDTTEYSLTANDDKNEYTIKFNKKDGEGAIKALDANTKYQLIITLDTENGEVVTSKTTFTTGYDANDVLIPELQSIDIAGVKAAKDAITTIDVAKGTTLVMTYDEKLKKDDLKVEITNVSDTTSIATVVNPTLSDDGTILTLPTVGLTDDKTYKVVISGLTDTEGNAADTVTFYLVCDEEAVADMAAAELKVKAYENEYIGENATKRVDGGTATSANIKTALDDCLGTTDVKRNAAQTAVTALNAAEKASLQARIDAVDNVIKTAATVARVEVSNENITNFSTVNTTATPTVTYKNADGVILTAGDVLGVTGYTVTNTFSKGTVTINGEVADPDSAFAVNSSTGEVTLSSTLTAGDTVVVSLSVIQGTNAAKTAIGTVTVAS